MSSCQILWQSVKPLFRYSSLLIFRDGGNPPSWNCYMRVWITHEEYLVASIIVQNLVGFGAVVNMPILTCCEFCLKMPIHTPFVGYVTT